MRSLLRELRRCIRGLRHQPSFTAAALITLILGIGATTAVFSVIHSVLLSPLPFEDADRLVRLYGTNPDEGVERSGLSSADFVDFRDALDSLEGISGYRWFGLSLTGVERPSEITTLLVTPGLLKTLGCRPIHGRTFNEEEGEAGRSEVLVLSHRIWQSRFGGDPALVGSQLNLDGSSYTVVGIAPPGFSYPTDEVDIWAPLEINPESLRRDRRWMISLAKLKQGMSLAQVQQEASAFAKGLEEQFPDSNEGWGIEIKPLHEVVVGDSRPAMQVLFVVVLLMLLIACANVANLLLARGLQRQREIALRTALGAGRGRLVGQLLLESLFLACIGGAGGIALAAAGIRLLVANGPQNLPRLDEVGFDTTVLLFALGASVVTGLLFGLFPALQLSRTDLSTALKDGGGRSGGATTSGRARRVLTIVELALALVLLVGAGLLLKGFLNLVNIDPGYEPDGIVATQLFVYGEKYREEEPRRLFFERLFEEIGSIAGVESVSGVNSLPLSGIGDSSTQIQILGRAEVEKVQVRNRTVMPGYFDTMRVSLLKGRAFTPQDREGSPLVAVINQEAARSFFGDQDPVGQRFRFEGNDEDILEVVGVAGDIRHRGVDAEVRPQVFRPFGQAPTGTVSVVVRTAGDPSLLTTEIESKVWVVDPDQAVYRTGLLSDYVASSVAQPKFYAILIGVFAIVALVLACTGLYGVISYMVSQRAREIGVRMALGARTTDVVGMVLKNGMGIVIIGVLAGLFGAVALTRLLSNLLYGVSPMDLGTFLWVPLVLSVVALLACYFPAKRAAALSPLRALRED